MPGWVGVEKERQTKQRIVTRMLKELGTHKKSYGLVCLFGLMFSFLEMIPPRLVGKTIDLMSKGSFSLRPVFLVAAVWVGVAVIAQLLQGLQIWLANRAGESILVRLRVRMFEQLQRLSMSYFDRTHSGKIVETLSNDVDALRNVFAWGINTLVMNVTMMLLSALMILVTDWRLFLAVGWLAPAMAILNRLYGDRVGAAWQMVRRHSVLVGANQAENIAGAKVVAAFNRQEKNLAHYSELQRINTINNVSASRTSGQFQMLLQWMRFLGQAIVLLYGGYRTATGSLRPGQLVAVSLYWEWFMQPAISFGSLLNDLLVAKAGAERIFSFLDEKPDVEDLPNARALPRLDGRVRFENVHFEYRPGKEVLHGIDFDVMPGTTVALVGATGSGKSTIISLLARFYQPQAGRVLFDGKDIRFATNASLRRQMAIVLQANYLFGGSVLENLRYGRPSATDEEIFQSARRLGCHDRFLQLQNGYMTPVGERGSSLSLGERQLICLTRALVAEPRILLLDEATSAIDPLTELQAQQAISELMKDRTTFVVAHRLSTIVNADLILVLEQGRIAEKGTHSELMRKNGLYAKLHQCSNREQRTA